MALRTFGPPSRALVDYEMERGGMPLHDAVGVYKKRGATAENQGAVPGIWAKESVFHDCVSVI